MNIVNISQRPEGASLQPFSILKIPFQEDWKKNLQELKQQGWKIMEKEMKMKEKKIGRDETR